MAVFFSFSVNTMAAAMLQIPENKAAGGGDAAHHVSFFFDKDFEKRPSRPECKWAEASRFWFVGFCPPAKACYHFHEDPMPTWPILTIYYGLWANLAPRHLISCSSAGCESFPPFFKNELPPQSAAAPGSLEIFYPIISNFTFGDTCMCHFSENLYGTLNYDSGVIIHFY